MHWVKLDMRQMQVAPLDKLNSLTQNCTVRGLNVSSEQTVGSDHYCHPIPGSLPY